MEEIQKTHRLSKTAQEFNVSTATIVEFLTKKGFALDNNPNQKLTGDQYDLLCKEFQGEKKVKETSKKLEIGTSSRNEVVTTKSTVEHEHEKEPEKELIIKNVTSRLNVAEPEKSDKKSVKTEAKPREEVVETVPEDVKSVVIEVAEEVEKPEKKEPKAKKESKEKKEETKDVPVEEIETKTETSESVAEEESIGPKIVGKINLEDLNPKKSKKSATEKSKDSKKGKSKSDEIHSEKKEKVDEVSVSTQDEIKSETNIPSEKVQEVIAEESTEPEPVVAEKEEITPDKKENEPPVVDNFLKTQYTKLEGPKILGSITLPVHKEKEKEKPKKPEFSSDGKNDKDKKGGKRQRIFTPQKPITDNRRNEKDKGKKHFDKVTPQRQEPTEEEINKQISETLARLSGPSKSKASKYRKMKREAIHQQIEQEQMKMDEEKKVLQVTEFVTVNELAKLMNVPVTNVISTCFSLGLMVSINQRLDAEVLVVVADEFGFKTKFVSSEIQENLFEVEDDPAQLVERHPIVTVMGHVDHGKTSLLDYIRKSNVIAGEAGGITQHIGAYEVMHESGRKITFLDTPGHEAFTAMRARGAKVTDIAIIVVAADDSVMPQTIEAINHAQAAKVPIIFAINKIDKPGANPEKIKEALANMNYLVEDWGGKYQCQEISAKKGINIDKLLEKVLLESEFLELKANPKRHAIGTILESSLDKGRGYVAKLLIQNGTLKIGDMVLAGYIYGNVKAMYNERGQAIETAGPSTPVLMLGLNGAPQAGDAFNVLEDAREAKDIANKRFQLQREQSIRTHKHITLDEIGRRIAIGDFKELNVIIKGDVDGSVEALSDSLLKLSTPEVQVNVIQKLVGQITESDVLLASASNAIIIGFQVRPSLSARKLAEQEQIDIRLYSVIYNAINELKSAIEGMLSPEIEEKIVSNLEVREVFKITKVGSVAGCFCLDGKMLRNTLVRIIRNGIVVYEGKLGSLKRFKDDVKEVFTGQECGLNIENYNDIKVEDIIEGYEEIEVKRTLK